MLRFTLLAISLSTHALAADLVSPIPSDLQGVNIPNAHLVTKRVFRGGTPDPTGIEELKKIGVTDFLIFKRQTQTEVDTEIQNLKAAGIEESSIKHIPFKWKAFDSFESACEQTLDALEFIAQKLDQPQNKVFFHCTIGEDRTGYLAGLYRQMLKPKDVTLTLFQTEMCENGYEAGNPNKVASVVQSIRTDLTPLFLRMAYYLKTGKLKLNSKLEFNHAVCKSASPLKPAPEEFKCKASSKVPH